MFTNTWRVSNTKGYIALLFFFFYLLYNNFFQFINIHLKKFFFFLSLLGCIMILALNPLCLSILYYTCTWFVFMWWIHSKLYFNFFTFLYFTRAKIIYIKKSNSTFTLLSILRSLWDYHCVSVIFLLFSLFFF